jgi:hypothetical protein
MAEVESLWIHKVAVTNHFSLTIYSYARYELIFL